MLGSNDEGAIRGQILAAAYFVFNPHYFADHPKTTATPGETAAPEKSAAPQHKGQVERA